jgi:transcriptional regulator with XRE-family HTH domain
MSDNETRRRPGRSAPADPAKITRARYRAGLTVGELADKAGIGRQHLSAIENGKGGVSIVALRQLAGALDVQVADLLQAEEVSR